MVNSVRGEAELIAGDKSYRLLLTLGALAEIEDGLGLDDLKALGKRLQHVRSNDLAIVASALMRGGGCDVAAADVLRLPCSLGDLTAAVTQAFVRAGLDGGERGAENDAAFADASAPFVGTTFSPPD
ncbi:MAG: GTA-gp10 family protein [Rhizomicrobium sp.]